MEELNGKIISNIYYHIFIDFNNFNFIFDIAFCKFMCCPKKMSNNLNIDSQISDWMKNNPKVVLDSINKLTAKYKTTEASMQLLAQLKQQIPEHNTRADITSTMANPIYTPTQEGLGDKLIDDFKVINDNKWADGNDGTALMNKALQGSTDVTEARKAELDAMSPAEKAAAVKEYDTSKYTALELMYLSGMDVYQAGSAIGHIFNGAGIGYNEQTGAIIVPNGHAATAAIYRKLESQYQTLWGGQVERGSEDANEKPGGADPFSWSVGDTTYTLAIDRDGDNEFDGQSEFVGADGRGVDELKAADVDGDGQLTAEEMHNAGFSVMENDQSLTGGGRYGWNGVKESGVKSIDLNSFTQITDEIKKINLNGNTREAEFTVNLFDQDGDGNDDKTLGKQTLISENYADIFYKHTYGEAFSFGLEEEDVRAALLAAAKPEDYTELENQQNKLFVANTENTLESNKESLTEQAEQVDAIDDSAKAGNAYVVVEDSQKDKEEKQKTEAGEDGTTVTTGTTGTIEPAEDDYQEENEEPKKKLV